MHLLSGLWTRLWLDRTALARMASMVPDARTRRAVFAGLAVVRRSTGRAATRSGLSHLATDRDSHYYLARLGDGTEPAFADVYLQLLKDRIEELNARRTSIVGAWPLVAPAAG